MIELRPGLRIRYKPVAADEWQEGELVRSSPNGEEWLVKNRLGKFWISLDRMRLADEEGTPAH